MIGGRAVVDLPVAAQQRHGERHPPYGGDEERDASAGGRVQAQQRRSAENHRDAYDERDRGSHVAPCVAVRGHLVHPFVRRGVDQHRIVERQRPVQSDGRQHIHNQERQPPQRQRHAQAHHHAGQEETEEELDLHALHVGDRPQDRHQQRDHQRGHGLRVPPCGHDVVLSRSLQQRVRVDRHHRGGQQHERGIADIVHNPPLLARREFARRLHRKLPGRKRFGGILPFEGAGQVTGVLSVLFHNAPLSLFILNGVSPPCMLKHERRMNFRAAFGRSGRNQTGWGTPAKWAGTG